MHGWTVLEHCPQPGCCYGTPTRWSLAGESGWLGYRPHGCNSCLLRKASRPRSHSHELHNCSVMMYDIFKPWTPGNCPPPQVASVQYSVPVTRRVTNSARSQKPFWSHKSFLETWEMLPTAGSLKRHKMPSASRRQEGRSFRWREKGGISIIDFPVLIFVSNALF